MGGIAKKIVQTVNKIDPITRSIDKKLGKAGLPNATDLFDPKEPEVPTTSTTDPKAEADAAAQQAALAANAKASELARQRRAGSVLSGGAPAGSAATSSVLAYGKARLGD
ncbi:hypothetical protein NAT65_28955 [Achromobacter xylosoxidans]|uniref:hypothetical protein n=1 Tax=Alcaligenes xylosoxydans xylosoxydans TaxID=85698 RepID=UPI0006C3DF0D|nr:hypothetical protein [Achromobacter xylosoxidans]MCM2575141.1 hypothetical protein [Achromobacter xylosoxidans]CUI55487.1 Uncharacterised protein [Achromobacter xylosoxidans]